MGSCLACAAASRLSAVPAVLPLFPFPLILLASPLSQKRRKRRRLVHTFLGVSRDDLKTPLLPISFTSGWSPELKCDPGTLAGEESLWGWEGARPPPA